MQQEPPAGHDPAAPRLAGAHRSLDELTRGQQARIARILLDLHVDRHRPGRLVVLGRDAGHVSRPGHGQGRGGSQAHLVTDTNRRSGAGRQAQRNLDSPQAHHPRHPPPGPDALAHLDIDRRQSAPDRAADGAALDVLAGEPQLGLEGQTPRRQLGSSRLDLGQLLLGQDLGPLVELEGSAGPIDLQLVGGAPLPGVANPLQLPPGQLGLLPGKPAAPPPAPRTPRATRRA